MSPSTRRRLAASCYAKLGDVNGARKLCRVITESLRQELEDDEAEPLPGDDGAAPGDWKLLTLP